MQNENVKSLVQKLGENSDPGVQCDSQATLPEAASVCPWFPSYVTQHSFPICFAGWFSFSLYPMLSFTCLSIIFAYDLIYSHVFQIPISSLALSPEL